MRSVSLLVLIFGVLASPDLASGQSVTGTILGTVRDTSQAVVPAAVVTLTARSTSLGRTVATNEDGEFVAPLLATGEYTVRIQAAGFKTASITGVELGVDQKVRVDAMLAIGDMTEAMEVRAENPLVQRSSSDLSATLTGGQIQALPLNGRNFVQLTRTMPGVARGVAGENIDGAGSSRLAGFGLVHAPTASAIETTISCSTASTTTRCG